MKGAGSVMKGSLLYLIIPNILLLETGGVCGGVLYYMMEALKPFCSWTTVSQEHFYELLKMFHCYDNGSLSQHCYVPSGCYDINSQYRVLVTNSCTQLCIYFIVNSQSVVWAHSEYKIKYIGNFFFLDN